MKVRILTRAVSLSSLELELHLAWRTRSETGCECYNKSNVLYKLTLFQEIYGTSS